MKNFQWYILESNYSLNLNNLFFCLHRFLLIESSKIQKVIYLNVKTFPHNHIPFFFNKMHYIRVCTIKARYSKLTPFTFVNCNEKSLYSVTRVFFFFLVYLKKSNKKIF